MARDSDPPLLAYIHNARSYAEQTNALRSLKTTSILQSSRLPNKANGARTQPPAGSLALEEEENVRLQALQVLSSFANAASLCVSTPAELRILADAIFAPESIETLANILAQAGQWRLNVKQQPVSLVTTLISRLCQDEQHALALADSPVLDLLAKELASFAVADGYVIPGAEALDGRAEYIPQPAPSGSNLASTLEALTTIVSDSRYRACRLLCSPPVLAVFPNLHKSVPWILCSHQSHTISSEGPHMGHSLLLVRLSLGRAPCRFPRSASSKFSDGLPVTNSSRHGPSGQNGTSDSEDLESPLIPWLIALSRNRSDLERLMATSLLTSLVRSGLGKRSFREPSIGLLVVPLLCEMLHHYERASFAIDLACSTSQLVDASAPLSWAIRERAPAVLSRLITDSEQLQKAAFDCGAVKILSRLMKDAYEAVPPTAFARPWSPNPDTGMDVESSSPSCRLGAEGQPPLLAHRIRMRETVLKAIGALAAGRDEYRKAFVDADIVPLIVQSLSTAPVKPSNPRDRAKPEEADGPVPDTATSGYGSNTLGVIIAACHAVRMHSRSVSILRTSLVDHGVSLPIFRYLKHPDVDVQIAATAAMCNLVTEVSPMREMLAERGVMKILCEHAHSQTAALRLNALWALKHFVHAADPDVKKLCLEQLEPGWLVRLICDDTEDDALWSARAKTDTQGEVDSGDDDLDGDVEMDRHDGPSKSIYGTTGLPRDTHGRPAAWAVHAETKKAILRDAELNPQRRARNDDLAIQEQGLDFIRNLIGASAAPASSDPATESTDMIEHLFTELGQDRFFDILAKKLQAKVLHPAAHRRNGSPVTTNEAARVLYPQPKIVEAVVFILVHMAASTPRHRQLVIAQTDLLKLLAAHFGSKDKEVRVALCHLVSNLTWQDDETDSRPSALRAHELRKLGMLGKLETLLERDPELDVRERAKVAVWQMKQLSF
ncbi:armadillo repeat protein [Verticillium dahliae]|nr:armadillo repeat protein [Verticillium dahliae]